MGHRLSKTSYKALIYSFLCSKREMKEETTVLKQRLACLELKKNRSPLYRYAYDALKFRIVVAKSKGLKAI